MYACTTMTISSFVLVVLCDKAGVRIIERQILMPQSILVRGHVKVSTIATFKENRTAIICNLWQTLATSKHKA